VSASDPWLADVIAASNRIAAEHGLSYDATIYGDHCVRCDREWCLPADKASCAHKAICETCYPHGCADCEAEVEEGIRRRERIREAISSAALEIRTTAADDLSEADMRQLDWRDRQDVLLHAGRATEALRRVVDMLRAQETPRPLPGLPEGRGNG
jgi:hypothetical protein